MQKEGKTVEDAAAELLINSLQAQTACDKPNLPAVTPLVILFM